ncbi:hypothetical protein GCM10020367_40050 [Streptomyces sannanensis]|uniref:Uncharacterized protein n=1 Tax=Streptomyces sannanensis TaxID=285536 RepID=A0ABP6SF57_9ACTN
MDLMLEITDKGALTGAALERIAEDELIPEEERTHAAASVREDEAEALAYLVDPFELVSEVPGVELVTASWSSEQAEYDPDAEEWDLDEEDGGEGDGYPGDGWRP